MMSNRFVVVRRFSNDISYLRCFTLK